MVAFVVLMLLLVALTVLSWWLFGRLDNFPIPTACPYCRVGRAWNTSDPHGVWHERDRHGVLRCRWCKTSFVEHSDGSLAPDQPSDS
jgi:hypothetical protein